MLPLAVHGVAYAFEPLLVMVPLGISIAVANGVGNAMGARDVPAAHVVARTGLLLGAALGLGYTGCVLLLGGPIISLFTADPVVAAGAARVWPWMCLAMCPVAAFFLLGGLNRGLGLQNANATAVLLVLWPCGAPLVWTSTSVYSVWRVFAPLYGAVAAAQGFLALRRDWRLLAEAVVQRQAGGGLAAADAEADAVTDTKAIGPAAGDEKEAPVDTFEAL